MAQKRADTAGSDAAKTSPVRTQWEAMKRQHPGRVLLFQLGDFYETFESDARIVARVCDITLTSRELSKGDRVPLAGVPIHRAAPHIGKLIAAGYHVAICDQVSEPGRGLVERQVTRVVTPGTVAEPGLVSPQENNLLVALAWGRNGVGLAAADVTTGEVMTTVVDVFVLDADEQPGASLLAAELQRLAPAECLVVENALFPVPLPGHVSPLPPSRFDLGGAVDAVKRLYGVSSLDGFGLATDSPALGALGALIGFVGEANYRLLASLREPKPYLVGSHVALDPTSRRNLELTRTARHGHVRGSLFHAIDRTRTPMGARRLRRLLGQPLMDRWALDRRLDAVEVLAADGPKRAKIRQTLGRLGDVERLVGRVRQTTALPREVMMLATALRVLPELQEELSGSPTPQPPPPCAGEGETGGACSPSPAHGGGGWGVGDSSLLAELGAAIDSCPGLVDAIEHCLAEPGGPRLIRPGYSKELDELVKGMGESRKWLAQLERRERERTNIRSLKVGYNKVFGYYLEVTRPNLPSVPSDYQRRQSLVSAERFVTPELKEREALILTAEARVDELEGELFQALLRKVAEQARPILRSVEAVADLDVLAGLADVAADRNWCRPKFSDGDELTIVGGRHPVLEAILPGGDIVPNDCLLGAASEQVPQVPDTTRGRLLIVTGPNMGGKSTYLRMVALCVLLAQVGSFVPASEARVGLVDRLFTRVGSEDDLAAGASTFLVEMAETASILRQATLRSLVVLDEVGRGTSTHDGLCIAQAVLEHLHDSIGARTLFATHFHELTALADTLSSVRNVTVAVDERDGQLAFLYRVVPGAADRSYGIQVAKLAGLLSEVTERAALLLRERELGAGLWPLDDRPVVLGRLDVVEAAPTPQPPPPCAGEGERAGGSAVIAASAPGTERQSGLVVEAAPQPCHPEGEADDVSAADVRAAQRSHAAPPATHVDGVGSMRSLAAGGGQDGLSTAARDDRDVEWPPAAPDEDADGLEDAFVLEGRDDVDGLPLSHGRDVGDTGRPRSGGAPSFVEADVRAAQRRGTGGEGAPAHDDPRSLDSARKLAPLGMTDERGEPAALGMTDDRGRPASLGMIGGSGEDASPGLSDALRDPAAAAFVDRASKLAALGMTGAIEQLWRVQGMEARDRAVTPDEKVAAETSSKPERDQPESPPPEAAPTAGDMDYPTGGMGGGNGRLRVREYGPEDGYHVEPRPDAIEQAIRLRAEDGRETDTPSSAGASRVEQARPAVPGAEAVAARLLAEILALDLGTMTPIRALTLLHELQTRARQAVPWSSWIASMAGVRDQGARDQTEQR